MKKTTTAMKLAHSLFSILKNTFSTFSQALKFAWNVIKTGKITFAKENGEIREADIKEIISIDKAKGFAKFIEKVNGDTEQFRAFRFERVLVA